MKKKPRIWIPIYIGDYMADTIGMTNAEHGAYLLSIFAYWKKGFALTPRELKDICGKDVDRVSRFYSMQDGLWHHSRTDEELGNAERKMKTAVEKSRKGVEARIAAGQIKPKP